MYGSDADDVYRVGYDVRYILLTEGHLKRGVLFSDILFNCMVNKK